MNMKKLNYFRKGMIVLLFLSAFVNSGSIAYASISDAPNFTVPDENTVIPSKYNFIAKFTTNTTVETFGKGWYTTTSVEKNAEFLTLNYSDVIKDKVGVIYRNVGDYNGEILDLKITINDVIHPYTNQEPQISYGKSQIEHMHIGVQGVDQTWEYISHETQKPVDVSGFMTINDIDYLQSIKFDKETSSKMTQIFGSSDSWIQFENKDGEFRFFEANDEGSNDDDLFATFTFTYDHTSKLRFIWSYESLNFKEDMKWDKMKFDGVYFGYIAKKPARSEINNPIKRVSDVDEFNQTENTLVDREETFSYRITHAVSDEYEEFYYQSYEFRDELLPELQIEKITLTNENNEDVMDYFENKSVGNTIVLAAKEEALSDPEFYGHSYSFEIEVKIKDEADLSPYTNENGEVYFPNIAKVIVDGTTKDSNEVFTRIPAIPVEQEPEKPVVPPVEKIEPPKPEEVIELPAAGGLKTNMVPILVFFSGLGLLVGGYTYYLKKEDDNYW